MLDWIDAESWEAFREMRRRIRAPLTPYAEKLIVRELVKLKAAGHDPQACLDQSIMLGWRDVFPVREKGMGAMYATGELEKMKREEAERATPEARQRAEQARQMALGAIKRVA